jgi:hypothetical protein
MAIADGIRSSAVAIAGVVIARWALARRTSLPQPAPRQA